MINFKKKKWKKLLKSLNLKYSSFGYGDYKQGKKSPIIENLENRYLFLVKLYSVYLSKGY